ncbi:Uncharacterised protein [Mycobacteroides abscessus subsp. abscessus]|nr:Uncharacterised protein [Mycobacteroides abscessus subsp. abscessus]
MVLPCVQPLVRVGIIGMKALTLSEDTTMSAPETFQVIVMVQQFMEHEEVQHGARGVLAVQQWVEADSFSAEIGGPRTASGATRPGNATDR